MTNNSALSLSWASPPSVSDARAYLNYVNSFPMLDAEREALLAKRLRFENDLAAAKELIFAHLRLVVKIARDFSGYGLPQEDLVQEGNVGLMKAVKRFDPDMGARLSTYATLWIKAEIQEYILENWRLVKIGASKGLRKLFFNLRKLQGELRDRLSSERVDMIASELSVEKGEVVSAQEWFSGDTVSMSDVDGDGAPSFDLPSHSAGPDRLLEFKESAEQIPALVKGAVSALPERERLIVERRWLAVGEKKPTLGEMAREFGVSTERVRQMEVRALLLLRENMGLTPESARMLLTDED